MMKSIVLFNPRTRKALAFESIRSAARYVSRDESTVRRAVTGDRNRVTVAGYLAIQVKKPVKKSKVKNQIKNRK